MYKYMGYGDNIPIKVIKGHKRKFVVTLLLSFVLLFAGVISFCLFNVGIGFDSSMLLDSVYADSYSSPDTWESFNWNGYNNIAGSLVWSDGINYYYSSGGSQYVLDIATSTWNGKTWYGLTNFTGDCVWSDGVNYYYSDASAQYVLDVSTSTWSAKTWNGFTNLIGTNIWTDGINYYYSSGGSQYVLDIVTSTWNGKTWYGLTAFSAYYVWSDGVNYYYSGASSSIQYVLDVSTSTWSAKTWNGFNAIDGQRVWSDGVNYYYSGGTDQFVLDIATSTWSAKIWNGIRSSFGGQNIYTVFTIENTVYWSYLTYGNYKLLHDVTTPVVVDVPAFTATQYYYFVDLEFDSDLDSLSNYDNLVLTFSVSDTSLADVDLFLSLTSAQLEHFGSYANKFRFTIPYKYIKILMYDSTDLTNDYSVDFTFSAFSWPALDVYDLRDGQQNHYGFSIVSSFGSLTGVNFVRPNTFGWFNLDVYNSDNTLILTDSGVNDYFINSFRCDVMDTSLIRDVSYRAQFRFVDSDYTGYYYVEWSNYGTLETGFTINFYDFIDSVNGSVVTGYSNWFNTPYVLTTPVLTYSSGFLSWTNVQGADYYSIYFDGNEIVSNFIGNSYQITDYGDYYVVANSNLINVQPAESNTVTVSQIQLATPVLTLTYTMLTWTDVPNADYYVLYILQNDNYVIYASNILLSGYSLISSGIYKVRAVSRINLYQDSELSDSVTFTGVWSPDGSTGGNTFASLIGAVIDVPVHYVISMLDFDMDFLGFNMLNFVMSMLTLCIVIYVVRFILARKE